MTQKTQTKRFRNWSFIVYPESAPENWLQKLEELCIPCLVSPLHDKDVNADGEKKKPHYHILLMFEGKKSFEQIKLITDEFNSPIPVNCQSIKGMARYLTHMDNPEKAQYSRNDIISFGGVNLSEILKPSSADRYSMIRDMINFINENQIYEYEDILNYSMEFKFDSWFPLLCDNCTYIIDAVIKSKRNRFKDNREYSTGIEIVNIVTGEVKEIPFMKRKKDEPENEK